MDIEVVTYSIVSIIGTLIIISELYKHSNRILSYIIVVLFLQVILIASYDILKIFIFSDNSIKFISIIHKIIIIITIFIELIGIKILINEWNNIESKNKQIIAIIILMTIYPIAMMLSLVLPIFFIVRQLYINKITRQ